MATSASTDERTGTVAGGLARHARDGALRYLGVLSALALLVLWLSITQSQFLTSGNLLNILQENAPLLVVSVGMTFVMLVGGFDLSVGGMLALSSVMLAWMITGGVPIVLAMVIAVIGAGLIGLVINGMLVAKVGLSFFVVTLGTASLFRGFALVKTKGETQGLYDETLIKTIGSDTILGIPILALIALTVVAVGLVVLRFTGFGRQIYAIGGNSEAARLAGINVTAVRATAYGIAAGCAGLAGVLTTCRLTSAAPDVATGIELTAAAAVLLGGTSLMGGSGGLFGTLLGVLFLGVLSNGLTMAGISSFWQGVVTGAVLVLAVLFDRFRPNLTR
jgi:ribose transport system permease protein